MRYGLHTAEIVLNKDNKIKFVEDDILTRLPARQAENYIYIYILLISSLDGAAGHLMKRLLPDS